MRSVLLLTIALGIGKPAFSQSEKENALLEALGGFSAIALYNTYIVIGATADGYAYEVYDKEMASKLVQEQIGSMGTLTLHCDKLTAPGLLENASDKEYIKEIKTALVLLKAEGEALKNYIETGDEIHQTTYQEKRNAAWNKIAKLLGLEK